MAYMLYQQYTTAVLDGYRNDAAVTHHLLQARSYRLWLESLEIDSSVKSSLIEQAKIIEEAFERLDSRLAQPTST